MHKLFYLVKFGFQSGSFMTVRPCQELSGELCLCFYRRSAGNSPTFNRLIIKAALPGLHSALHFHNRRGCIKNRVAQSEITPPPTQKLKYFYFYDFLVRTTFTHDGPQREFVLWLRLGRKKKKTPMSPCVV